MALSINPAVSGGRRGYLVHGVSFFIGAVIGGTVTLLGVSLLFLVLRAVLPGRWILVPLLLALYAVARDLGVAVPLPYRKGQVPEWLRNALPPAAVAAIFGFILGIGFLTFFTYSTQLAVALSLGYLPSLSQMLIVVVAFALGKSVVLSAAAGTRSLSDVSTRFVWGRWHRRVLGVATAASSLAIVSVLVVSTT